MTTYRGHRRDCYRSSWGGADSSDFTRTGKQSDHTVLVVTCTSSRQVSGTTVPTTRAASRRQVRRVLALERRASAFGIAGVAPIGAAFIRPVAPAGARAVQAQGVTGGEGTAARAPPVATAGRGPTAGRPGSSALGRPGVVPVTVGLLRPRAGRATLPVPDTPGGLAVAPAETRPVVQAIARRRRAKVQARVEVTVQPPLGRPMGAAQARGRASARRGRHALRAKAGPGVVASAGPPGPVRRATAVRITPAAVATVAGPVTLAVAVDGEDAPAETTGPVPIAVPVVAVLGGVEAHVEVPHARIAAARTTEAVRGVVVARRPPSALVGAAAAARAPEAAGPTACPVATPDRASQRQVPIDAVPPAAAAATITGVAA